MEAESASSTAAVLVICKVHQQKTLASAAFGDSSPRREPAVNSSLNLQTEPLDSSKVRKK